jgi:hypothetical protein
MKECVVCNTEFEGHHNKKYCDAKECQATKKEKSRLQAIEYSMRPEIKAKRQEREKREDVKALKKEYLKRPEVKAARTAYNVRYNREVTSTIEYEHICKLCNNAFTSWRSNSIFCNPTCKDNWWKGEEGNKYRADRKRQGPFDLICEVCNERFIHPRPDILTCSEECYKIRRRATNNERGFSIKQHIRRRFYSAMRHHLIDEFSGNPFDFLDYAVEETIVHLEAQFTDGISWDNMSEWEIDHIRPVSSFSFDSTEHPDFKKCWALNNLQPLWAEDNLRKGNKWDGVMNA